LQNSIQRTWLIAPNFAQCDYTIHFKNCTFTGDLLFGDGPRTLVWLRSGCWRTLCSCFVRKWNSHFYHDLWMYVLLFTIAISNGNLCCNINFLSLLFRVLEVGALPLAVLVTGIWCDNWFCGGFRYIWETPLICIITSRCLAFRR
jgi:hypothetical protein